MFHTLMHLKGNPRVCIYTEPLWSIPYNLFIPYAAIFMRALGVTQIQIGYIITIGMISQVIFGKEERYPSFQLPLCSEDALWVNGQRIEASGGMFL